MEFGRSRSLLAGLKGLGFLCFGGKIIWPPVGGSAWGLRPTAANPCSKESVSSLPLSRPYHCIVLTKLIFVSIFHIYIFCSSYQHTGSDLFSDSRFLRCSCVADSGLAGCQDHVMTRLWPQAAPKSSGYSAIHIFTRVDRFHFSHRCPASDPGCVLSLPRAVTLEGGVACDTRNR